MASILVTGAAGFIAARTAQLLAEQGHRVVATDNLCDSYDVRLKLWRKARLEESGIDFVTGDICDLQAFDQLVTRRGPFDAILNLAARAGVRYSVENPLVYYQTNVIGTLNLLQLCRTHGIRRFVLASTSSLYNGNTELPFHEDLPTDQPLSPYAASKKAAETLCYTYHHLFGINVCVLRYFTVYGPAGRPDMSPFRFVKWIVEGQPITLYGDGTQSRDFTFVDDVAAGTAAALDIDGFQIINLGSDRPVSLLQFLALIEKTASAHAKIDFHEAHVADMKETWAAIEKARSLLGWQPRTRLEDGVKAMVDWYLVNREWARDILT